MIGLETGSYKEREEYVCLRFLIRCPGGGTACEHDTGADREELGWAGR